jgi:hypothetical protein
MANRQISSLLEEKNSGAMEKNSLILPSLERPHKSSGNINI